MEATYDFVQPGLTRILDWEHNRRITRYLFPAAYAVIITALFIYWMTMVDLWTALIRFLREYGSTASKI